MSDYEDDVKAYDRVSRLTDFIISSLNLSNDFSVYIRMFLWKNKELIHKIDKEVENIWLKKLK